MFESKEFAINEAETDFHKARSKAFINEIQHFLSPEETTLLSLTEAKTLLKPRNEVYRGMQVVPINEIVGSEGRYSDFDNHFFPKSIHLKNRWRSIDVAHLQNVTLPPIRLYELGGLYFVRDGNHRVSVAKSRGIQFIDAEVTSLQSEIQLKPGALTQKQVLTQVLDYEKRLFYAITAFGDITDCWDLDFSSPGQYDVVYNHILSHKYYINQGKEEDVTLTDGIISWYNTVYLPVINVIQKQHVLGRFRRRTASDLYVWLIKYWDDVKQQFGGDYSLEDATKDFKNRFSESPVKKLLRKFGW